MSSCPVDYEVDPLSKQDHRPWPVPQGPWLMTQVWRDLLFAHWAVPPDSIRSLIPKQFTIDTFEGQAWVSITPFHMSVKLRGLPQLPGMSDIPELNCRTYVTAEGKPGVYFFSLDTVSHMAVWGARALYHLPYFHAEMRVSKDDQFISSSSRREYAMWRAKYTPSSDVRIPQPGTLDYFLAERYCLYTTWNGQIYRGEIHHLPWPLQEASATIEENTVAEAAGIAVPRPPDVVSFARELKVLMWPLTPVEF